MLFLRVLDRRVCGHERVGVVASSVIPRSNHHLLWVADRVVPTQRPVYRSRIQPAPTDQHRDPRRLDLRQVSARAALVPDICLAVGTEGIVAVLVLQCRFIGRRVRRVLAHSGGEQGTVRIGIDGFDPGHPVLQRLALGAIPSIQRADVVSIHLTDRP